MKHRNRYAAITLVLGGVGVLAIMASHLALTDIQRGIEPNLEAEWWVVRYTFVLIGFLVLAAGALARAVLRDLR